MTRRRAARLEELLNTHQDERVRQALADIWQTRKPPEVRVRPALMARGAPDEATPPAAAMVSPNGQSLRFYLTCLFVAACSAKQTGKPVKNRRPLTRDDPHAEPGWSDLLAIPARADAVKERSSRRGNRLRQIKSALVRLDELGLVTLGRDRGRDRFERFLIYPETGRGDYEDPVGYRVPGVRSSFPLPAQFFLSGWVWALSNSEIATYLMLRLLAWHMPREHASDGVFVTGTDREDTFDLGRDAYESHLMLAEFGLIRCNRASGRYPDGKWELYQPGGRPEPHRFQLLDDGLDEPAIERVLPILEG
jgi:hypothetical protein